MLDTVKGLGEWIAILIFVYGLYEILGLMGL